MMEKDDPRHIWVHFFVEDRRLKRPYVCAAIRLLEPPYDHHNTVAAARGFLWKNSKYFKSRRIRKIEFNGYTIDTNKRDARCFIRDRVITWSDTKPLLSLTSVWAD